MIVSEHALHLKLEFTANPSLHNRQTESVEHIKQFGIRDEHNEHFDDGSIA